MKIKRQSHTKTIVTTASLILVILLAVLVFKFYVNKNPTKTVKAPGETSSSDKPQSNTGKDVYNKDKVAPNADRPPVPKDTNESQQKNVIVTASVDKSEGTIYLRGGINYPVKDGECYAILTGPSGQTIRKDTTLLQNPMTTDCKTIAVPLSELSPGGWSFILRYNSETYKGASDATNFAV